MEALIYDFDGTIVDSQGIHAEIESKMLAGYGISITPEEISRRFSGVSFRDLFQAVFSEVGRTSPYNEEISNRKMGLFIERVDEIKCIEGTIACIEEQYRYIPLAIASATRPEVIELILNKLKIRDRFKTVASSREVKNGKPAPDVFLLAAKRLGVRPSTCVVIEDGISGMIGAKAAGMRCVGLVQDFTREYPADFVTDDLRKVPFDRLFG
jgi:beta-phosphoglucomutase-like phosphatase (HAD superfamily)